MEEKMTPEMQRELGKACFFSKGSDHERKMQGMRLLLEANSQGDPEAMYIIARLLLGGALTTSDADPNERALKLMCTAANKGCVQARAYLNAYCEARYDGQAPEIEEEPRDKLLDFYGKPIRINRQGMLTPVDAVLTHEAGRNVLTLRTNLLFVSVDELKQPSEFRDAVIRGISAWQGEYEVFNGQRLEVRVELTQESRLLDSLWIIPLTREIGQSVQEISGAVGIRKFEERVDTVLADKRSFASAGFKWSVTSRKIICVQSEDGNFDDFEEIMHVAKHEFGHILGLGDLYEDTRNSLAGVKKGTYAELDSYAITDKVYNLVMCDHHGPISNNDIEMIVLAYRENKMQLYQSGELKGQISAALGKGN